MEKKTNLLEALSAKIGGFSIYLGVMLFFNLYLFRHGRSRAQQSVVVG